MNFDHSQMSGTLELEDVTHAMYDGPTQMLTLWVVEDDARIRALVADLLNRDGHFECRRQFPSAESLLVALKSETPPEVILMDLNLGGMSGIDAIRLIKPETSGMRILIMTTFYDGLARRAALEAGASGFLLKSDDIPQTVGRILESSAHGSEFESNLGRTATGATYEASPKELNAPSIGEISFFLGLRGPSPVESPGGSKSWLKRMLASCRSLVPLAASHRPSHR
jgi:DNA-binding NarL/FixJ family response regulator